MQQLFNSISRWCVIALAAVLPIAFFPGGFVTIPQGKMFVVNILVGVAALAWFIASAFEKSARIPRHAVLFTAILLPLGYVLSTMIAGWPSASVVSGLAEQDTVVTVSLWFATLATTALILGHQAAAIVAVIRASVLGAAIVLVFQIVRLFSPEALSFSGTFPNQTVTAVGNWHDLGILLGFMVVLCGALLRTRMAATGLWRIVFAATAVLSFLFLVVISMQDVWFVLAGITGLFGVYAWFAAGSEETTARTRSMRAGLWLVVALSAFLLGWFNTWIHDRLPERLQVTAVEVRPSWEGTYTVGQNSLADSRALLFGTGPNSFARNWAQHKPEGVNATLFWNLDFNTGVGAVPTSFVTVGALGIAAWVLLALAFLWTAGQALRATRMFDATQTTVFSLICAILFLLAFHIMYSPGVTISALLFMLLGVFIALPLSEHSRGPLTFRFGLESVGRFLSFVGFGVATLAVVVVSIFALRAVTSDVLVNRSVLAFNQNGNVGVSSAMIQRALSVWPSNDRAHRAAVELGILELAQLAQTAPSDTEAAAQLQETLQQTIEHGLAAVEIDRVDYQNWLTLAQLYQELAGVGIEGAYEQAQAAYNSAKTENPSNPLPLFRLGQLEAVRGNRTAAITNLDAALALKPDLAPAHFLRSQLLAQENRIQDAVASAVAVVQLAPQDPLGWYNLGVILYIGTSYSEAGAAFAQAVTLQPDYSNALFMLGLSFHRVGDSNQAIVVLSRVQELNPSDQTVPAMIANLRAGKDPLDGLAGTQ